MVFVNHNKNADRFISADKSSIDLPVPLGSKVYEFDVRCGQFCFSDHQRFISTFGGKSEDEFKCSRNCCMTVLHRIYERTFTINNLRNVLEGFGTTFFATRQECEQAAWNIINERRKNVRKLGFQMDDSGYGLGANRSGWLVEQGKMDDVRSDMPV